MKRRNDQRLKEVLDGLVEAYGLREKLDEQEVVSAWDQVVGGMVARHTSALQLRRGKLTVRLDSAPLRHELTYMRTELVRSLNERFGREVVKEIILQ
jgi:predicted nucleic acid-binding Zn ribbon protein